MQRVLAGVRDRQKSDGHRHAVAMEVSSHALVQSRVEGIHFDVAVFTNLSHDHLDYHGTMEDYFEAKALLFTPSHALRGVVHADDPWGRRLLARARIPTVAVHRADATDVVLRPGSSEFTWRGQRIRTPLTGAVNVDNALLAAEAALALEELDLGPEEIAQAMANIAPVPGRLQVIAAPGSPPPAEAGSSSSTFTVLVDYAHTPAGLEVVLARGADVGTAGAGAQRLRVWWEPGPGQAPPDGRGGGAPERPGLRDVGQPSRRRPADDHWRGAGRGSRRARQPSARGRARSRDCHPAGPRCRPPR